MEAVINNQVYRYYFRYTELKVQIGQELTEDEKLVPIIVTERATECVIEDGALRHRGVAHCCSRDQFNYEKGRKIALTRAIFKVGFLKRERAQFWEQYLNRPRTEDTPKQGQTEGERIAAKLLDFYGSHLDDSQETIDEWQELIERIRRGEFTAIC